VDILDANAGNHGRKFATNFNAEINIRELTQTVQHWSKGKWIKTVPIIDPASVHFTFDYPVAGKKESYLLHHDECESLVKFLPGLERIRFWMTFSENYLTHLRVMHNIGLTSIEPIDYEGKKIVPIKFLKALLPNPASLAKGYTGKTCIGCIITGVKNGKESTKFIYNVCDHAACYREIGSQAISYTTGVPAMATAMMMMQGTWMQKGVYNIEQLDPEPFMKAVSKNGLPFKVVDRERLPDTLTA
jgi:saccharopine dehydrogenase (NAD+, L-lysine-forming)